MRNRSGRGFGNPPIQDGGTDYCICSQCGNKIIHKRGVPCVNEVCPICGINMVGTNISENFGRGRRRLRRWRSVYQEANIFGDFKKILSSVGFRDNDIKDIVDLFQTDFQDLDYKGIMNELVNNWDIDEPVAKNLYNVAKKNRVV